MEEDISIWRKPGHFYFALTRYERWASSSWFIGIPPFWSIAGPATAKRQPIESERTFQDGHAGEDRCHERGRVRVSSHGSMTARREAFLRLRRPSVGARIVSVALACPSKSILSCNSCATDKIKALNALICW